MLVARYWVKAREELTIYAGEAHNTGFVTQLADPIKRGE